MKTFRPVVFADTDLRAFKYISAAAREGVFCSISAGSSTQHIVAATLFNGTVPATFNAGATGGVVSTIFDRRRYFPIYQEDPDTDTVQATIDQNDFCIGFALRPGNEFQVHKTVTESGFASTFTTIGGYCTLGSTGKLTYTGAVKDTGLIIGQCLGTIGAAWIRVRVI